MYRKKKSDKYIHPMPKKQFFIVEKQFNQQGGKFYMDNEAELILEAQGAEACTLDAKTILLRKRPTRAAVYEELFHAKQFSEGSIDGTLKNMYECEIEAKKYLLDNANVLELTQNEITQTKESLKWYLNKLEKMKGDS